MKLSIVTSCHNRAKLLERVWQGLVSQSSRDFEWVIGNDGSTDNVEDVATSLALRSDFPITFVDARKHVGKSRIDNAMIKAAKGDLVLFCDSDDYLTRDAVEAVIAAWRPGLSGVTGLATEDGGTALFDPFYQDEIEASWRDLADRPDEGTSDMTLAIRTDLLRETPFPEVDLLYPEGAMVRNLNCAGGGPTKDNSC
ncbi:glycosyltransferase family A protein [Sphingomonas sp. ASV193]|uniref:glycosyltransferase family 2 protein n=1 Tax=Sphingomonas sp. ASV193 TaxID=3144405 RepID=UPI0032E8F342